LNMGTSRATFYLGKQVDAGNKISTYLEEFMNNPFEKIKDFIKAIIDATKDQLKKLDENMKKATEESSKSEDKGNMAEDATNLLKSNLDGVKDSTGKVVSGISKYVKDFIKNKYRVKFLGIINALTGGPSTPWHITIGNPMRPIFCSGDMLCTNVEVNFGPQLSFNDLPTFIEVTVTLTSARNLGLQEIFSKFNSGGIRVVSGTSSVGEYIAGIADSFWNSQDYTLPSGTSSVTLVTTQQSQSTDNTNKTDNAQSATQSNATKVTPPDLPTLSPLSITNITPSVTPHLEISTDPRSIDPVTPSGSNISSDNLRKQETQDATGSTEGFTNQLQEPKNTPNTGVSSKTDDTFYTPPPTPTDDKYYVPPASQDWKIGERVNSGSMPTYTYVVTKSKTNGIYESQAKLTDGTSYIFQGTSAQSAIDNMNSHLNKPNIF